MVQALINLGCVLRLLPIAGVPLPLVSYGGSALIGQPAGRRACCWPAPAASRPPAPCWPNAAAEDRSPG